MSIRSTSCAAVFLLLVLGVACRQAPPPAARPDATAPPSDSPQPARPQASAESGSVSELLGRGRALPIPDGLVPGGDCPPPPTDAEQEIAAQAQAAIPLVEGLTLAYEWTPSSEAKYECLIQVKKIDKSGILTTVSCDAPGGNDLSPRLICRADLRSARMLHTLYGAIRVIGASGEQEPETITGATAFSISSDEFARLNGTGAMTYHYVEFAPTGQLAEDAIGDVRVQGREKIGVLVNDRPVNIQVIKARGILNWRVSGGERHDVEQTAVILDDARFPLLIDSENVAAGLGVRFMKITYPRDGRGASGGGLRMTGGSLEEGLLEDKRVDVYGIYFDFNSDRIRPESEPILQEIGSIMKAHADWRLSIQGHTDNVGGNGQYNLELSRRRSEAVRLTLVNRFGISADRLSSGGFGAASPKDTNDTPEGRARNRRVELVRH